MKSPQITWISSDDPPEAFPNIDRAFDVPDGLLAAGGDLSESRLLYAYRHGIFPWFNEGQPILWWSPEPRCVIVPGKLHVSRRLCRSLRQSRCLHAVGSVPKWGADASHTQRSGESLNARVAQTESARQRCASD